MASTYLSKTFSAGNQKTWTWSFWTKIPNYDASNNKAIFSGYNDANNLLKIQFANTDQFQSYGLSGGTLVCRLLTNQKFRDYNGWYHIVYSLDTTQATSTDRQKLWVNGEEVTSFSTRTDPSQNADLQINNTIGHQIGAANNADHYSNCMAHCHFIDGTRYDASYFGETDSTTGIWKPKTAPSVTYGTNGFFLKFENSGAFGTDSSGNGNTFTVNGTMTQTIDTPSNVFATMNPLYKPTSGGASYSNGNTTVSTTDAGLVGGNSTLAVTQGKWYAEFKKVSQDSGTADDGYRSWCGVTYVTNAESNPTSTTGYYILIGTGRAYNGSTDLGLLAGTSYISDNGILQIALDLDNNQVSFGFNGGWMDGSNGWTNSTPTNWISITDPASTEAGYFFTCGDSSTVRSYTTNWNFGNGYFGTTAVSSAQNPDDGIGIFEYDVPTGYRALCTKSINAEEYS
jgi:hypothetical protein